MKLTSGYDRRVKKELKEYRHLTLDEVKALKSGQHVKFIDRNNEVRDARVNGKIRTWKRTPSYVEIPMKYGFREYWSYYSYQEAANELVTEVE